MAEKKEKQYVSDNAQLVSEWDWEKNTELGYEPQKITCGCDKKVWWICHKNHEWQAVVSSRHRGRGCPYCSNKKVLKGYNDLQTVNPTLAKGWNYIKNNGLTPGEVVFSNTKEFWWKCLEGHEWQARITDRNRGNGCPYCSNKKVLVGYNDLQTVTPTLAKEWNYEKNGELKPVDVTFKSDKCIWWKCSKDHEWQAKIYSRYYGSGCPICNSERRTSFPEYVLEYYLKKFGINAIHSYKELGYELDIYIPSQKTAIEYDGYYWHKDKTVEDIEKNQKCEKDGIKLYRVREGLSPLNDSSIDYVLLKDQKDLSEILEKILSEIVGFHIEINIEIDIIEIEKMREHTEKENSFLFTNPLVAQEWNYDKNGNLRPEHCTSNSQKKMWWICGKGHEWQATIANRNHGYGCPYCTGQKVLQGYNDLQTLNPAVVQEWNHEKNGGLMPEEITANSHKKVWWKCSSGHEWQATIKNRNHGHGCPYCATLNKYKGHTKLQLVNPKLTDEWNYERNGSITPADVMPNTTKKVWWKCAKGHEWQARIDHRNKGSGCPYCAGQKVLAGTNDLQTINPALAKEWNYDKNGGITPAEVMPNSHKKVWWKCSQGHEYLMVIKDRNRGCICPECAKQKRKKQNT